MLATFFCLSYFSAFPHLLQYLISKQQFLSIILYSCTSAVKVLYYVIVSGLQKYPLAEILLKFSERPTARESIALSSCALA